MNYVIKTILTFFITFVCVTLFTTNTIGLDSDGIMVTVLSSVALSAIATFVIDMMRGDYAHI